MSRFTASVIIALIVFAGLDSAAELSLVSTGDNVGLYTHNPNRAALLYVFGKDQFKPYAQELYTPNRVNILRDAPSDHLHHHGLMFAIRVNGVNFWEERDNPGKQKVVPGKLASVSKSVPGEGITESLEWIGPGDNGVILNETRTIVAHQVDDTPVTLLSWQSVLHDIDGKPEPKFHGTNYNGLGMRFLESMDKGGSFFNADGATGVAGTVGSKSNWCAYTASADGKPVTVAMFDHPTNERHPATWYTMDTPFAYLSATLALDKEPLQKKDLTLTYGVAAWDGTKTKEEVEEMYQRWLKLVEPLVASTAPAK
ncbi:MAG: PmoA family protein [Candidatus Hydrogenedentes bacterium]|nr:PmoA family protein [Candidatus Hydrogenedentota bacterium]